MFSKRFGLTMRQDYQVLWALFQCKWERAVADRRRDNKGPFAVASTGEGGKSDGRTSDRPIPTVRSALIDKRLVLFLRSEERTKTDTYKKGRPSGRAAHNPGSQLLDEERGTGKE